MLLIIISRGNVHSLILLMGCVRVKVGIGPCLGLSWSNVLTTRIFLKRLYPVDNDQSQQMGVFIEENSKRSGSPVLMSVLQM